MLSDVLSYVLLTAVFVVMGLRLRMDKPNKLTELRLSRPETEASKAQDHRR
jgi:hypothetical protein